MRSRRRSSFGTALRSTIIPGWGQLVTNRPVLGRVLIFVSGMAVLAAVTVFLFVEPIELYAWLANPDVLLFVVLANLMLAALRLFATGHAWVVSGGRRWFAGVFLAVFVGVPHVAVAWVGLETRGSLLKLFPDNVPVATSLVTTTTTAPAETTSTVPASTTTMLSLEPVAPAAPGEYGSDAIDLDDVALWRPFGEERLNILLLGGDAGPGRSGLRTDTMIVASIDPVSGDAALIGVPRNFGGITLKDGTDVPVTILNAVYRWGHRNSDLFPGTDPGAEATRHVIENITGLEIDHYMLVDLTGFADVVDAFGGVRLDVPRPVDGPLYDPVEGDYEMVRIPAGSQHLDGGHALAYARARYGSSDYARMGRQRCILAAMARDADFFSLATGLPDLLDVIETNMSTDVALDQVPDLIRLAARVDTGRIRVVGFDYTWSTGKTETGYYIPDVERIRSTVLEIIENPEASGDLGVATAEAVCG